MHVIMCSILMFGYIIWLILYLLLLYRLPMKLIIVLIEYRFDGEIRVNVFWYRVGTARPRVQSSTTSFIRISRQIEINRYHYTFNSTGTGPENIYERGDILNISLPKSKEKKNDHFIYWLDDRQNSNNWSLMYVICIMYFPTITHPPLRTVYFLI